MGWGVVPSGMSASLVAMSAPSRRAALLTSSGPRITSRGASGALPRQYGGEMVGSELVFVVEEAPESGYVARALGESIVTEADDLEALREMIRDAVACHFDDDERPKIVRLHLVHDELLAV